MKHYNDVVVDGDVGGDDNSGSGSGGAIRGGSENHSSRHRCIVTAQLLPGLIPSFSFFLFFSLSCTASFQMLQSTSQQPFTTNYKESEGVRVSENPHLVLTKYILITLTIGDNREKEE